MKSKLPSGVLKAMVMAHGGANVEHLKLTKDMPAVKITPPEKVVLPMQQHIGAPCSPTVKVGDHVDIGQVVGDTDKFVAAPIHASVSGKVTSLGEVTTATGTRVRSVTIENDGLDTVFDSLEPPKVENKKDLLKALRDSGLVGLGGAGFPTHAKLAYDPHREVDTLIVNAAECEPYITVDYRECIDRAKNVMGGIETVRSIMGIKHVVIAVEDNKPDAINVLKSLSGEYSHVHIMALKAIYPQGAEKLMVLSATGRRVPPGKLPADVGCLVMNVATIAFLDRFLKTGKPLVTRSLTVSGDLIKYPKNLRAPIGTSVRNLIDFCGGFVEEPYKIVAGGPMMGTALYDIDVPILKNNNAILALSKKAAGVKRETDCIHCGRCSYACPMFLVPTDIENMDNRKDIDSLIKSGVEVCMECGSCAFVCPASKPLVQYMRLGKQLVREAKSK